MAWGHFPAVLGERSPPTLTAERLHASMQCYPSTFLVPFHARETAPGYCTAIHVRQGVLLLRVFVQPDANQFRNRVAHFEALELDERNKRSCFIIGVPIDKMMHVSFLSFCILRSLKQI